MKIAWSAEPASQMSYQRSKEDEEFLQRLTFALKAFFKKVPRRFRPHISGPALINLPGPN